MKAFTVLILISLVFSLLVCVSPVKAEEPLTLTIKPDGSLFPDTSLLERNGTTYTFKGDIFGTILVQTGYITIDGAGHTLQGRGTTDEIGINLAGPDLSHRDCRFVLVENLRIYNCSTGIFSVGASNNSFIGNYLDKSGIHLQGGVGYAGDLFDHNTFRDAVIFVDYNYSGHDNITENNFFNSGIFVDLSEPPIVDRNYQSNYTTAYPNATEIGNTGIGSTPYVYQTKEIRNETLFYQDNNPLMKPISIPGFPLPTPTPSPTPTSGAQTSSPALLWIVLLGLPAAILVGAIIFKRKSLFKKK